MNYVELVKMLPKIEIDGVPIEYGKTKVIYDYNHVSYEGIIVYNDDSDRQNLLFLSDEKCYDFNDELIHINSYIKGVLTRICDEKYFEYRNYWVDIKDLKLAPKKTDIHITTSSGLKIDTTGLTAISSNIDYPYVQYEPFNYVSYDTSLNKDFCEKCILGMWNTEEEKERGNKMELINIYKEKSIANIANFYDKKITEYRNNNKLKQEYDKIINEANEKLQKLYETQDLTKRNLYELKRCSSLDKVDFCITYNDDDVIAEFIDQQRFEKNTLFEKLNEVEARIECIEEYSDNEYEEIMKVLKDYNIVDEKGKVTPIDIKPKHVFDDGIKKRRGRKPSKKSE